MGDVKEKLRAICTQVIAQLNNKIFIINRNSNKLLINCLINEAHVLIIREIYQ